MILSAVSLLDCAIFIIFLVPNIFKSAELFQIILLIKVLPFLLFQLPYQFLKERYFLRKDRQSPFVQQATIFEDIVVRCVRYAFANLPTRIGRVFFSKWVALPFFRFRLLRHGYLTCPVQYHEVDNNGVKGLWIHIEEPGYVEKPDVVVLYCHGGGFSMGSSYFYLEFLVVWLTLLKKRGFRNPAIFALDYTLVPDATWPKQFQETQIAYKFLCNYLGDSSRICVSGDSAGATLVLSRLLQNGNIGEAPVVYDNERPGLALLLSPWTHLVSHRFNRNTPSDYLDASSLHLYGRQYAGKVSVNDPIISPGDSTGRWKISSPSKGYYFIYGSEEVFAAGIEDLIDKMKREGATVEWTRKECGIHAWPVVDLFLADTKPERLQGLHMMTDAVFSKIGPKSSKTIPLEKTRKGGDA